MIHLIRAHILFLTVPVIKRGLLSDTLPRVFWRRPPTRYSVHGHTGMFALAPWMHTHGHWMGFCSISTGLCFGALGASAVTWAHLPKVKAGEGRPAGSWPSICSGFTCGLWPATLLLISAAPTSAHRGRSFPGLNRVNEGQALPNSIWYRLSRAGVCVMLTSGYVVPSTQHQPQR